MSHLDYCGKARSIVNCSCNERDSLNDRLVQKLQNMESELVSAAQRMVKGAGDPFSGVMRFLLERPDNTPLQGYLVDKALLGTFGSRDQIPGLIRAIGSHVREVIRSSNVIRIINEHPTTERWGDFIIKQKEDMMFELFEEKGCLVLKNITGLSGIERGIEVQLEKIKVEPPKLIVTARMGLLSPQRVLDI